MERGANIDIVSVGVDPNEDAEMLIEHAQKHGFTWKFAVSPKEFLQSLIDEFSVEIAGYRIVIVCPDKSASMLGFDEYTADEMQSLVNEQCS